MAVTIPHWQCNIMSLPNMALLGRNYCSLCIGRCNKNLCLGIKHADYKPNGHLHRVQFSCNGRKLKVRASASGFEDSDSVDNDAAGGGVDDNTENFWDKKEIKEKLKEMEAMRELIEEAEKLEEAGVEGSKEESEEERKKRVRDELARRAREQAEQRRTAEVMFQMGQRAYGKGMYNKAVEFLEAALTNVSRVSFFGGEIQLWLAMAYDAHNRHSDCIALYKSLEKTHPNVGIRKQAAGLRYIVEAPKLKITKDEMVSIPLIASDYDRVGHSLMRLRRCHADTHNGTCIGLQDHGARDIELREGNHLFEKLVHLQEIILQIFLFGNLLNGSTVLTFGWPLLYGSPW